MDRDVTLFRTKCKELLKASEKLPDNGSFALLKVIAAFEILEYGTNVFSEPKNPVPKIIKIIDIYSDMFKKSNVMVSSGVPRLNKNASKSMNRIQAEETTKKVYGDLWQNFSRDKFLNETYKILSNRLKRNNVSLARIKNKKCLDAGCGGGRYAVALFRLGAKEVTGLDMSEKGLADARRRVKSLKINNVKFLKGNVLNLSFPEKTFDFVFSNGVLHHTVSIEKGISEISRVLKNGGTLFLYVEGKGGLFWDMFFLARKLLRNVPKEHTVEILKAIGLEGNRIFYYVDVWYVPIQTWVTPNYVENVLKKYRFGNITRLYRGTDYDRNEFLFNPKKKHKYAVLNHGLGQLRYIAEKMS